LPPGPRFWDSHLFPSNPRQTVQFVDTFPPAVCLGLVRVLGVGCPTKPGGGVGFLYLVPLNLPASRPEKKVCPTVRF
jgi:hypothetical protein